MKRITIYKAIDQYKKIQPIHIDTNNDILEDTNIDNEVIEVIT